MIESKNLLHVFKHKMVKPDELTEFLTANPNIEKRIGCLPPDWLKNINKEDIPKITQLVNDVFEKSAIVFSTETNDINKCKNLCKKLKNILNLSDINIKYAGTGGYKVCHKITVGDYSYALSTFKKSNFIPKGTKHGRSCEPQNIFTAYNMMSHGRVSKPFMARVSSNDESEGGYILSQFVTQKEKSGLTPLEIKLQDFEFCDADFGCNYGNKRYTANVINGVLIDVGGMKPSTLKLNNIEKKIALYIEQKIISESNIVDKTNVLVIYKILNYLKKLSNNGIDIYSADLRDALKKLKPNEQKIAIKLIRIQRKLIKFLQNLNNEEQNSYENAIKSIDIPHYNITTATKNILYH